MQLNPTIAAKLATAVYGARINLKADEAIAAANVTGLADQFDIERGLVLTGTSGAGLRQTSGFALVLPGKGPRQGEYVVSTRGTVTLSDWLSNANAAMETGPGGHLVHAGFNRVSKSLLADVLGSLRNKNPSAIHCVGHSLGGAVSNLIAAQIDAHIGGASLYTFGAPRVGVNSFSDQLTWSLGDANINRAFNISDAVPMVPIFPFFHAPNTSQGALVGEPHGLVSIGAHFMSAYGPAVDGQSWQSLRLRAKTTAMTVDQLLDSAGQAVRIPGGGLALHLLGRALAALISAQGMVFGTVVAGTMTVIDRFAWILASSAQASFEMGERVIRFLKYAMRFTGRTMQSGASLSAEFVGYVLGLLLRPIASVAHGALSRGER